MKKSTLNGKNILSILKILSETRIRFMIFLNQAQYFSNFRFFDLIF